MQENLSLKSKLAILFVDYIILIGIVCVLDAIALTGLEGDYACFFWLAVYLLYYVFPEYIFKRTFGMRFFKVTLKSQNACNFKIQFLKYSVLIFNDRILLLIIYIFGVLLQTDRNLLLSEKLSNFRWRKS